MVFRPAIDGELCFVLLPLRHPFLGYFEKIIKPAALAAGLKALKADEIYGTRAVISDIWESIWKAKVVVAIVTDKNPNVNYELGICHSLGVPTVLITRREEDVPFDYRHRRYIKYESDEADWQQKLIEDLTKTLKTVLSSPLPEEGLQWPYDTFDLNLAGRIGTLIPAAKARSIVIKGAELVARSLAAAFGPDGSRISVTIPAVGRQAAHRRGTRITDGIKSGNPIENQGVEQIQRLSHEVSNAVGDCTKTAALLCAEMLKAGDAALAAGYKTRQLTRGMERATEAAKAYIVTQAGVVTENEVRSVAMSACSDDEAAGAVVEALRKAGKDGIVQILSGVGPEVEVEYQEGMSFGSGFLSPLFVTDDERQECVLEDASILIYERQISSMRELLPVLEQVAIAARPLLIIAQDVVQEALATLVLNKQRGTLRCAAVKTPGFGDNRSALLQDIATLVGGKAFLEETLRPLSDIKLSDLGRAKKIVISKNATTLIGGFGSKAEIEARTKQLRKEISQNASDFEIDRLKERLAKLAGGIVVLRAAGRSEDDLADSRYKIESALHSCYTAIENGYVVGAGITYCRARASLEKLVPADASEKMGIDAVSRALTAPLRVLVENSRPAESERLIDEVLKANGTIGFNAETGEIEDLLSSQILDSAKALHDALALAFVYAEGVLKTAAWDSASPPASNQ